MGPRLLRGGREGRKTEEKARGIVLLLCRVLRCDDLEDRRDSDGVGASIAQLFFPSTMAVAQCSQKVAYFLLHESDSV
jgi:hypothetical protein